MGFGDHRRRLELKAAEGFSRRQPRFGEVAFDAAVAFGEVVGSTQQQRVSDSILQMAVRTFDHAVLMRDAPVVVGWLHAVIGAQRIVAPDQIPARIFGQIAETTTSAATSAFHRELTTGPGG